MQILLRGVTDLQTRPKMPAEAPTWLSWRSSDSGAEEDTPTLWCPSDPAPQPGLRLLPWPLTHGPSEQELPQLRAPVGGALVCDKWKQGWWVRDEKPATGNSGASASPVTTRGSSNLDPKSPQPPILVLLGVLDCFSPPCSLRYF